MVERTIWNEDINLEDWQDYLSEEHPDVTDECEQYELVSDLNYSYLDDERANLDKAVDGEIIAFADLGLWNGRVSGYKMMGDRISNILYPQMDGISNCHWYSDGKNICCRESHHDGTNSYVYRVVRSDKDIDRLFSKRLTEHRIRYYTRSLLPDVAKVYGWE